MRLFRIFSLALMLSCAGAQAGNHHAIVVSQALARATIGSQANGAAFLTIENRGKTDDALISASSPAASIVEIHTMRMEGDVMKMRAGDVLPLDIADVLDAKVAGVPVMRCTHGQLNGQYAVKVLELLPAAHQETLKG